MRKLDKEHLKIILWIVIGITLLIYIPYGLAYTSLWFQPFHYVFEPVSTISMTTENTTYYAQHLETEIPHWNLMLMAWCEGAFKLLISLLVLGYTAFIGCLGYYLFDWLFPRVDNKKDGE